MNDVFTLFNLTDIRNQFLSTLLKVSTRRSFLGGMLSLAILWTPGERKIASMSTTSPGLFDVLGQARPSSGASGLWGWRLTLAEVARVRPTLAVAGGLLIAELPFRDAQPAGTATVLRPRDGPGLAQVPLP